MLHEFKLWYKKVTGETGLCYIRANSATEAAYNLGQEKDIEKCIVLLVSFMGL